MSNTINDLIIEDLMQGMDNIIRDFYEVQKQAKKYDAYKLLNTKDIKFLNSIYEAIKEYEK